MTLVWRKWNINDTVSVLPLWWRIMARSVFTGQLTGSGFDIASLVFCLPSTSISSIFIICFYIFVNSFLNWARLDWTLTWLSFSHATTLLVARLTCKIIPQNRSKNHLYYVEWDVKSYYTYTYIYSYTINL